MEWLYEDENELIEAIDEAVSTFVSETEWEERLAKFTPETPFTERLAFYQELRKAGILPAPESFFLVAFSLEAIADEQIEEIYRGQYQSRFEGLEKKYGIDPEEYLECEMENVPAEYEALNLEFGQASHTITVATFEAYGEHKMAALYKHQPDEYTRRYMEGSESLLGSVAEVFSDEEDEEEF